MCLGRARFRYLSSRSARDSLRIGPDRIVRAADDAAAAKGKARNHVRATNRPFRSARRNAGYNLIDLARGGGILQVLKTTAHQTAMLARPRFTCPGTVSQANSRAVRDVIWLYRRMSAAHVTQQSRWACKTSIADSCFSVVVVARSTAVVVMYIVTHSVNSHISRLSFLVRISLPREREMSRESQARDASTTRGESLLSPRTLYRAISRRTDIYVRTWNVREKSARIAPDTRLARANTHAPIVVVAASPSATFCHVPSLSHGSLHERERSRCCRFYLPDGATLYCLLSPVLSRARVRVNACPRGRQMQPPGY